ncbi:MAG: amino acid ABC transporter substrate-binding protein [Desulfobacteraceae bacterium]|nr:amino acid ABC transporter substrate-binding protein [Desulfobacteraceae bacterium]
MKQITKKMCYIFFLYWAVNVFAMAFANDLQIWTLSEPPGNFLDKNGKVTGLSVEYVREIQRSIGNTDEIRMVPWKRIYRTALQKPNIVFFSVARTPEREEKFHWIALVMRKPWALYSMKRAKLRIKSLEDAKKVKFIGVMRGDVRADWLLQHGFTNLNEVKNHEKNIQKLFQGRVDLIFYSPHGAANICRKLGFDFNRLDPVLFPYTSMSYIAMSKNGTSLETVKLWQKTAQQIKDDGQFKKIAEKWVEYTLQKDGIEAQVKDNVLNFWKE